MIQFKNVSFERADRVLFENLNISFVNKRYGLIGANGVGKSTLAKLMVSEVEPDSGTILRQTRIIYLAQTAERTSNEEQLSGGEWMKRRIERAMSIDAEFMILDEPTNHLDTEGKSIVYACIRNFKGGVLVISHDRELLRQVDEVLELTAKGIKKYGGNFDFYREQSALEKNARLEDLKTARKVKREKESKRIEEKQAQQKRVKRGEKNAAGGGLPKILIGRRKRLAETTTAKVNKNWSERVEAAEDDLNQALTAVATNPFLRLDFSHSVLPASKTVFRAEEVNVHLKEKTLWASPLQFQMKAQERWRLAGANGTGKSTLLKLLSGNLHHLGSLTITAANVIYLDQDQSLLDNSKTVLGDIEGHSRFSPGELRNELAFYGFTKDKVHQKISTLSGGERLKAALAKIFLGEKLPQVLLLDEPTNNLDFQSLELLGLALNSFRGLLVIACHDEDFVNEIGMTDTLSL